MKIAVLSDQHIHRQAEPASFALASRAFEFAARFDHVILAGDTFDSAEAFFNDREQVRDRLEKLGLWSRDRLTVLLGNHDMFYLPHRGSRWSRSREFVKNALSVSLLHGPVCDRSIIAALDEWMDPLSRTTDRLTARAGGPLRKQLGHLVLYVADTTPRRLISAASGFWRASADALLRTKTESPSERRVLAMHHPPKRSKMVPLRTLADGRMAFGFPPKSFSRLDAFLRDERIEAIVCGHLHAARRYTWRVGRSNVPAYMVGRSGGLHGTVPRFGVLEVPRRADIRWSELRIDR
jgi:predicted phosphodiesterase